MTDAMTDLARGRRARLDELGRNFLEHFTQAAGFAPLDPEPAIPHHDRTILFTNSAVVPFKPFLLGESALPAPGVAVRQPCVRAHNLDDVFEEGFATEFVLQFEMLGVLAPATRARALVAAVAGYLTATLGLDGPSVAFKAAHDDTDLCTAWEAGWTGPVLLDTEERDYYRWGFGHPRLGGRGATLAVRQADGRFRDLGNLIAFERDGEVAGYGFGIGLETLAACLDGSPWVLDCTPAGAVVGARSTDEAKLADLLGLLVRLYAAGVRTSSRAQGHVLRRAVSATARLAAGLGLDQARLLHRLAVVAAADAPGRDVLGPAGPDLERCRPREGSRHVHDLSFWCADGTDPDALSATAAQVALPGVHRISASVKDVWHGERTSVTLAVALDLPPSADKPEAKQALRALAARLGERCGTELRGEIR
ncbi:alanine--tRNA ligase-related protein [Streptomyces cinnamoneus]|uniref:alanine--tRNA ligase-related protein n=1 Tax=Streptomyces cinnamoneus TaxID=53446 RepID=UPI0034439D3D